MFIAWKCRSEGGLIALNLDGDENSLEKLFAYIFSNAKCVTSSTLRQSGAAPPALLSFAGCPCKIWQSEIPQRGAERETQGWNGGLSVRARAAGL